MHPDDHKVAQFLLEHVDPSKGVDEACPDDELIAGLLEGRLTEEMRDVVQRRLAASREGRELAVAWQASHAAGHPSTTGTRWRTWLPLAAAAVVLVALGAGLWAGGVFDSATPDPEARLVAAARQLAATAPDVFADFQPLSEDERNTGGRGVERGALIAHAPVGIVLTATPSFSWSPVAGATRYVLVVHDVEGTELVRADVRAMTWTGPPGHLRPGGDYVWEIATNEGPLGRESASRSFRVASPDLADRWRRAQALIEERPGDGLGTLLAAHLAVRWKLYEEAARVLEPHVAAHSEDRLANETLALVRRRFGRR